MVAWFKVKGKDARVRVHVFQEAANNLFFAVPHTISELVNEGMNWCIKLLNSICVWQSLD
jgi:hypothetical protein